MAIFRYAQTLRLDFAAAAWGFAEAIFFFIVPDVLLSRVALNNPRRAYSLVITTLIGAVLGGAISYSIGSSDVSLANQWLDAVPAINPEMIAKVINAMPSKIGWLSLLAPLLGNPTKFTPPMPQRREWP
jgi:membrane protein YqaA with SNARE-associated domain